MTASRPKVLLPYQARWWALGRREDVRWRVAEKARQVGLTWTEGGRQASIAARALSAGGRRCLYVSTSLLLAREYISTVATWARGMHGAALAQGLTILRDGADDVLAHEVRFASGFTVTGVSSNPAAFRGRRGEVFVDEGAHHHRLDEILRAAFAVTQWGGRVTVISTHNGVNSPFVRLINQVRSGAVSGVHMRVPLERALQDGLYRRICKLSGLRWSAEQQAKFYADCMASPGAAQEFRCEAAEAGAVFYRRQLLEACARPGRVAHLERPADWTITRSQADRTADTLAWCERVLGPVVAALGVRVHYLGHDYGRRVHLAAVWLLEQEQDLTLTTPLVVELRRVPTAEQEMILDFLLVRCPRVGGLAVDVSEGGGHTLAENMSGRWGWRAGNHGPGLIVGVTLTPAWYDRAHQQMRARLEERDLSIVRDEDVVEDFGSWRETDGAVRLGEETVSRRDGGARHGDTSVAALLAQSIAPEIPQAPKYREMQLLKRSRGLGWP